MPERIVGLDIGTRSIVGIILEKNDEKYEIIATAAEEHPERAMIDGQIHEINLVSNLIKKVIVKLEEKTKTEIKEVAIAAAGRLLKTARGSATVKIDLREITNDDRLAIEVQAIKEAYDQIIQTKTDKSDYTCVGYSTLKTSLDDIEISNIVGQRGEEIKIEIIATFLPRIVLDSLIKAVTKVGLKIKNITLEPIAAANIAIPTTMRHLNIALIDIGAGTSDIAISSQGTLVGYGMVPEAGDEITEKLAETYLLDFNTAEKVKISLNKKNVKFKDITGITHNIASQEIIEVIKSSVNNLARNIATKIIEINGKVPQAVICVGGGSLTIGLKTFLAENLDLPEQRIALKGKETLDFIAGNKKNINFPLYITPIGIALSSLKEQGLQFIEVYLNERPVKLIRTKELNIADVLLQAGINLKEYYGRPGKALSIEINDKLLFLRGEKGVNAQVFLNTKLARLEDQISEGDIISYLPAKHGLDRVSHLSEIPEWVPVEVIINKKSHSIYPEIIIDGREVREDVLLEDNSKIYLKGYGTVREILLRLNLESACVQNILINNLKEDLDYLVQKDDKIEITISENVFIPQEKPAKMQVENKKGIEIYLNGDKLVLKENKDKNYILSDIFKSVDIVPEPHKKLLIKINEVEAGFTSKIKAGDKVEILFC